MARLTKETLEKYLLLVSTTVTSIFVAPILGFSWAAIDPIESPLAVPESRWLFWFEFPLSIVGFIMIYSFVKQSERNFLKVALIGFPSALLLFLMTAQIFTRWLRPLDHQNFANLLLFTLAVGIAASSISMLIGKLVTLGIVKLSFPQTKLP